MSTGDAWTDLAQGLLAAGRHLEASSADLGPAELTDGYLALLRGLNNLLGRFETDQESPELTPFNGWREKFFMDNPDVSYWITDIRDDRAYRIIGNIGCSVYQSITVYTGTGIADSAAASRMDTDEMDVDADGNFEVELSPKPSGTRARLELPEGSTSVWVRYVRDRADDDRTGWCRIEPAEPSAIVPASDPERFARHLSRLGSVISHMPQVFEKATAADRLAPNTVRHWTAMAGGAAFTEPGIHYVRGAWQLEHHEALIVEGPIVPCRHWNIVLYNQFLNSLDYRHRVVSRSAATSRIADGHYRFTIAGRDPGLAGYDWLDTEGRPFGLFVIRFLQPESEPALPQVRRMALDDLGCGR